jgi:hypothetical protein
MTVSAPAACSISLILKHRAFGRLPYAILKLLLSFVVAAL